MKLERKTEPTRISREEFILRCQDALEVFAGQIHIYQEAINKIHFLVQKASVFEQDPDIRVSYFIDEKGQAFIETEEKKFGFLRK